MSHKPHNIHLVTHKNTTMHCPCKQSCYPQEHFHAFTSILLSTRIQPCIVHALSMQCHPRIITHALSSMHYHPCNIIHALSPIHYHPCIITHALSSIHYHPCNIIHALSCMHCHSCIVIHLVIHKITSIGALSTHVQSRITYPTTSCFKY